jgi:hypothetical protein
MKSVKNLLKLLEEATLIQPGWKLKKEPAGRAPTHETIIKYKSNAVKISNETYGRKSMVYLMFNDEELALFIKKYLQINGYKPNSSWDKQNPKSYEIPVSYFKGQRWWE